MAFAVTLGLPPKAGQEMPQETIVTFHGICLRLGLGMEGLRDHVFIRLPIVTHHGMEGIALDGLP